MVDTRQMVRPERIDRLAAVAAVGTVAVGVSFASMLVRGRSVDVMYDLFLFHNGPNGVVLLWLAVIVLRRQPGHGSGRALLAIGAISALHTSIAAFADQRLVAAGIRVPISDALDDGLTSADLPLDASIPLCVMNFLWIPLGVLAVTVLPLVFPDGKLPSARWRPVLVLSASGASVLMVILAIEAWPTSTDTIHDTPAWISVFVAIGGLLILVAAIASFVAVVRRWRSADGVGRRQFRPVTITGALLALVAVTVYPWQAIWIPAMLVAINLLLVAYALTAARYRLHDLEPILGRAAVAAAVSLLVAGVYAAVVVGIGAFVGRRAENRVLPIVAVALVVLLIEPTRRRVRRVVHRHLYRADTDRVDVLAQVTSRASDSGDTEDVIAEVTQLLVRSTGAQRAEAWLDIDGRAHLAAAAGDTDEPQPVMTVAIAHRGERLGELRLHARAAPDLVPDALRVLQDVASALGLVVRNGQLAMTLEKQLRELRLSRQRLVEAHDRARRQLERDIHDGAQSRLIALRMRIGAARARVADDHDVVRDLDALGAEVDATVRTLRDLARGLHPPILEQSGVTAALRNHLSELSLPVTVSSQHVGRYRPAVELAVYFACLEAIQNAVRHGDARTVRVEVNGDDRSLRFTVRDDGVGFNPATTPRGNGLANIDDRIGALGGVVCVLSTHGDGTVVHGEVPAQRLPDDR
jgi:signal transduction histidine kinase